MSTMENSGPITRCIFAGRTVIGVIAVLIAMGFVRPVPLENRAYWPVRIVSLVLIALGLALRASSAAFAGHHTRSNRIEAPRLITSGPYAHVRNPIYLGSIILGLGMIGLLGDPWLLPVYIVTLTLLLVAIIPAEEKYLRHRFGEEYARYRVAVPRLLPRWHAWPGAAVSVPDWSAAFGELWIAALLIATFVLLHGAAYLRNALGY